MKYHTTKNGEKILISDMDNNHLINTMNMLKKIAEEGLDVGYGGGNTWDDFWYNEETVTGEEALDYLNFRFYKEELDKRQKQEL